MQCQAIAPAQLEEFAADAVVVPLRVGGATAAPVPAAPTSFGERLAEIATRMNLSSRGNAAVVPAPAVGDWRAGLLVLVTVSGEHDPLTSIRDAIAGAMRQLASFPAGRVVVPCTDPSSGHWPAGQLAQTIVESAVLGCYTFASYLAEAASIEYLLFPGMSPDDVRIGAGLGQATNLARDLVNTPAADLAPADLADRCVEECGHHGIPVRVLDERELAAGGFGGIAGVGRGAASPPRLVVLGEPAEPLASTALIGKGITFDSGGLSLKDALPMATMKCDMAGAAAVLAAMVAAAELGVAEGVVGYLACAENAVGAASYRPGDVLRHRNGKTAEVSNTDAEGRLILADALAFAAEQRPARMVDIATLTGATGLGPDLWGVLGTDHQLVHDLILAGQLAGEPGWELPLWNGYTESLRSDIADLKNLDAAAKWGHGAILGALYLREFVADIPWAHLDIAATAFRAEAAPAWAAGATGSPVRTLVTWLRNRHLQRAVTP